MTKADASKREDLATPRRIDTPSPWARIGDDLILRLAWVPSFEVAVLWEVRSHDGTLAAYRSRGTEPGKNLVVGYERLPLGDAALRGAIDRLTLVTLDLTPRLGDVAVADGDRYVATIQAGFDTACCFSWIVGSEPKGWSSAIEALVALRDLMDADHDDASALSLSTSPIARVHSRTSTAKLARLDSGEFQVWEPGILGSLLCGFDYILAAAPIAEALVAACGADIEVRPARIIRRATGESWSSYVEIIPIAELEGADDLPRARLSTTRAWHYRRGHLFVNGEAMKLLAGLALPDLSFSPGFGQFGGHRGY
jgi:hypothetical protein